MLYKELCCVPGHCAAQASVSLSALGDGLLPEQLRPGLIVKDDRIRQQIGVRLWGRYQTAQWGRAGVSACALPALCKLR